MPFVKKFYGNGGELLPDTTVPDWPPQRLQGCPRMLADFVKQTLTWKGEDRITAATAKPHVFLEPRGLGARVALARGKKGCGAICVGELAEDALQYLQECPSWSSAVATATASAFANNNNAVRTQEKKLGFKSEHAGIIEENNPPKSSSLNGGRNLALISSKRVACFLRAVRAAWKPWLEDHTDPVRKRIRQSGIPEEFLDSNGKTFLNESFADTALVYASVQIMSAGPDRSDGWRTDGESSLSLA